MNEVPIRKARALRVGAAVFAVVAIAALAYTLHRAPAPQFLTESPQAFAQTFAPPPAQDSAQTRAELDELLALQAKRTPADVAAAQADRKTRISRFADALGLAPDKVDRLVALPAFAETVEDEIRPYIRAAKDRFRRLRPYEIEPRIEPCIDDVRGDLSYPSGHSAYGYAMAWMLIDMVPERQQQVRERADRFARQRMVCGVHFGSDIEAGRRGAEWLMQRMQRSPDYRRESDAARRELRAALGLPAAPAAPAN